MAALAGAVDDMPMKYAVVAKGRRMDTFMPDYHEVFTFKYSVAKEIRREWQFAKDNNIVVNFDGVKLYLTEDPIISKQPE